MKHRTTSVRRVAWSLLAGLSFGTLALVVVAARASMTTVYEPIEVVLHTASNWAGFVVAGGASWWLIAERGPGPTRERAALAGGATAVVAPWLWGALFAAATTANWAPPSAADALGGGPLEVTLQVAVGTWAYLGAPVVLVAAGAAMGLGRIRRGHRSADERPPPTVTGALASRVPLAPTGRRQWVALGAAAYLVAGLLGTLASFGSALAGSGLVLVVTSVAAASAVVGGLAAWALTAGEPDLGRTAATGAGAGMLAVPLASGPVYVGARTLASGGSGTIQVLAGVKFLPLLQLAAVCGGTIAVALVAGYRQATDRGCRDPRTTADATPDGPASDRSR